MPKIFEKMLQGLKYVRVIPVDDDPDDREFFQEVVGELPYEIELTVYKNGQEFLNWHGCTQGQPARFGVFGSQYAS